MIELGIYHQAEKLGEGFYRIAEANFVNMYLFIGEEKALLVDMGCGGGNLPEVIRKLTDKPLIVAVTHRHPDHIGASGQMGVYYSDFDDVTITLTEHSSPDFSKTLCERAKMEYNPESRKDSTILPITDETVFDLGNRRIVTEKLAGHSMGSRIFIEHETKTIITGDAANSFLFMQVVTGGTVEDWITNVEPLIHYIENGYTCYNGHGDGRQLLETVLETRQHAQELVQMAKEGKITEDGMYPTDGWNRVFYVKDRILSAK